MAKAKAVSQLTIAKALGIDRNRVAWGLMNDARLTPAECAEIQAKADELGYKRPIAGQHHNSGLNQEKADSVVEGILLSEPLEKIASKTGIHPATALKYIRGVAVPADYPETEEDWRKDVIGFFEIALWKGTKRLATSAIDEIAPHQLPISLAISSDKLSLMKGQPTSFSVNVHQTINHREFLDELKGAKQAQVVDADSSEA
jgi:hypothetical protein